MTPNVQQFAPPDGFDLTPGGLVVPHDPAALRPPLEPEQWTQEEAKAIARYSKLLERRGLVVILGCRDNRCAKNPELQRRDLPGGFAWVCQHKARIVLSGR